MIGLLLKDIYNLKNNIKNFVIIAIVFIVLIIFQHSENIIILASTLLFSVLSTSTIIMDYNAKWNKFAVTTPISRKDIVYSKYILFCLFTLSGTVIGLIVSIPFIFMNKINPISMINLGLLAMSVDLLAGGILLYSSFLFSKTILEKMQLLIIASYGLSLTVIMTTYSKIINKPLNSFNLYCALIFAALLVLFVVSANVSAKIYASAEIN
ncbi:MAG: ABC-2 transporter permease [Bacillota bacterium]|nr:ABC-2 transporter permease [Bacillota bacterium]